LGTIRKVVKNTGVTLAGNLIFRLVSLVLVIYLAKYLGVEEFGKYNFVFAYLTFFGIITDLGLGDILVREMARDSEKVSKIFGNVYIIKLILSIFAVLLVIFVTSLVGYPADTTTYIYVASITLLFQAYSDIYRALFQTTLKMEFEVTSKLIAKLVSVALIFYIIIIHGTLFQIILVLTISELIRTLSNYCFSRKIVKAESDIDLSLWKHLFKESLPVALSGVFLIIYHRIDILMLSMMEGSEGDLAVGLYSAAYKLSEPLGVIPYSLIISLFPIMSKSFKSSEGVLIKSYEMGYKFIVLLMLPTALGTTLIADKIILLVYDQSYMGSIAALQILIWAIPLGSINYLLIILLTSIDKQRLTTLSMSACVVANILMNYMLIPQYSYNGASLATVATELILFILTFYFVSKNVKFLPIYRISIKPVIACLIMGIPVYYLNNYTEIGIILIITSAVVVYIVALLGLKTFSSEDKALLRKFIR
jgi:O-antigen/teichoic acid export membrane protein